MLQLMMQTNGPQMSYLSYVIVNSERDGDFCQLFSIVSSLCLSCKL